MTVSVRPATPADADAWARMRHALWPDQPLADLAAEVARYFSVGVRTMPMALIAVDDRGEPVGFAELNIRTYAEDCVTDRVAFLEGWFVEERMRRRGVGGALIATAEAWGRAQGCTEFASDARLDNELSARAHVGLGFTETGQLRTFRKDLLPRADSGR